MNYLSVLAAALPNRLRLCPLRQSKDAERDTRLALAEWT